jgi:hypothetical protein
LQNPVLDRVIVSSLCRQTDPDETAKSPPKSLEKTSSDRSRNHPPMSSC